METIIFLIVLALIWIAFASIHDLRKREVANWLSFSLIIFALGFRFFYSLFSPGSFDFFYQGLIGLGIFFILGNCLYYGRLFAGGDAKLMIALGTILPFSESFFDNVKIFALFIFIFLIVGGVYGLIISLVLSMRNFKSFKKEFFRQLKKNRKLNYFVMFLGLIFLVLGFFVNLLFIVGILVFVSSYIYSYLKAIDEIYMVKKIKTTRLTEGDWLYKDMRVGKKLIKADWEGLGRKDIRLIKKKYRAIFIRQGIPFVPVFFISFLVLLGMVYLGNPFW